MQLQEIIQFASRQPCPNEKISAVLHAQALLLLDRVAEEINSYVDGGGELGYVPVSPEHIKLHLSFDTPVWQSCCLFDLQELTAIVHWCIEDVMSVSDRELWILAHELTHAVAYRLPTLSEVLNGPTEDVDHDSQPWEMFADTIATAVVPTYSRQRLYEEIGIE